MSTRKKLGRGSSGHYISRGLLPRIKEYVASSSDSRYVDVERMASDLQAQYSEYSRKKRTAFFHLVSEVYLSHRRELTSPSSSGRQSGVEEGEEERLLCQREREHLKRSRESVEHGGGGSAQPHCEEVGPGAAKEMSSSESDEEEDQRPNFNILNDSLVDIYRNGREGSSGMDQQSCDGGGVEGGVSDEQSTAACDKSSDQQTSNSHETMSHDVVEPHPPSSMLAPVMSTSTNEGSSSPVECADAANSPLSEDGGSKQVTKKVSFSSPEVTDQHDYVVAEESRMRRVKKRKSKRHDDIDEGSKVKRKRSEDESSTSSHLRAGKSPEFAVQSSSVSFSDVGGSADCLHEINKLILHMRCSQLFEKLGVRPPQGFLLHGPPGCGKTLIAHAVAGELGLPFIKLAATEVVSGVSGESEGTLRDLFQLAKDHAPCVLFIDEVDAICRKRETAQREMERRIVTQLLTCLDDLNASTNGSRVLVIGATSRPDSLDPALRRAGRFDREICVGIPDLGSRVSILKVLCRNLRLKEGFNFSLVADLSPGFVGADLMALVTEAALVTINRVLSAHNQVEGGGQLLGGDGGSGPSTQGGVEGAIKTVVDDPRVLSQQELDSTFISTEDFIEAIKHVQPSAKREGFATVPNTTWADVGALQAVREELSMAILAPVRYPDQFDSLGLSSPPGVLLAGPPGCGKTLLAKAIANESGINFISVKGPELLNMYVGESERAVRQVFQRARNSSPCVIFFDELDALCPRRSDMAETSASARVVNQLLTEMDGLESRRQVFIMAATNRPDIIDPAVMRPGRLDKLLYVGLPSPSDRAAILNTITKGGQRPRLGPDVDLETVASDKYCKGFSGADLTAVVREASIDALKEHMTLNPLSMTTSIPPPPTLSSPQQVVQPAGECVVCMRHFVNAFQKTRASVSPKDQDFYQQMADRFHHQSSHNKN